MEQSIRSAAMIFAGTLFFIMALVGWLYGLSPATCCSRAVAGAVIAYIAVMLAGKIVKAIIINSIVEYKVNKVRQKDK